MKVSTLFLLSMAVALAMLPFSLSAVTLQDVTERVKAMRTCPAPQMKEQDASIE